MHLVDFFTWLNNLPFSVTLRQDEWPFPIIESFHILGLGLSVGIIMWVDLRLIGVSLRRQPVSQVVSQLEPWAIVGFGVMIASGFLLFIAEPLKCYLTVAFRFKVVMLILAASNIRYFHTNVYSNVSEWDDAEEIPWQAKMVGCFSMILWFGIIIAGRWTAYL
jgi:hypothetical protein